MNILKHLLAVQIWHLTVASLITFPSPTNIRLVPWAHIYPQHTAVMNQDLSLANWDRTAFLWMLISKTRYFNSVRRFDPIGSLSSTHPIKNSVNTYIYALLPFQQAECHVHQPYIGRTNDPLTSPFFQVLGLSCAGTEFLQIVPSSPSSDYLCVAYHQHCKGTPTPFFC